MKNKLLLLTIVLAVLLPMNIFAQSVSIWNGTSEIWTQGQGTESSPYLIENAQQLAYIAEVVNGGVTHYDSTYFKLTTNVFIDSTTSWEPIGLNETYYFGGHFDGDNHLVTLYLTTSTLEYLGVFGYAKNGSISNLGSAGRVTRTIILSNAFAGGICGYSNATITNCYNNGDISSNAYGVYYTGYSYSSRCPYSGGICGYSTATITSCHNSGNISSYSTTVSDHLGVTAYAGGICGYSTAAITSCYNTGNVSSSSHSSTKGSSNVTGGICGYSSATIKSCHNSGNISSAPPSSNNYNYYSSNNISGGICGSAYNNYIDLCYNTGNVSSSTIANTSSSVSSATAGGICGSSNSSILIHCYNTGIVSSINNTSSYHSYSGGISGESGTITSCYNAGSLLSGSHKGGISGEYGTITNCYYLNTCGHTASTGGTAKTAAQMKSSSFPVILNTDSVVFVIDGTPNINQGYPIFGSVTTLDAENVGNTVATLKGNYQMLYDVDTHGFEYKKSSESNFTTVNTTGEGPVSYNVSGLEGGTAYTYRFFVQKDGVTYRGVDKTFNTVQCSLSAQIIASPNILCLGDTVTYTAVASSTNASPAYTFQWSSSNSNSILTGSIIQGPCPNGWHVPSDTEWTQFTNYISSQSQYLCGNNSTSIAKAIANQTGWNTSTAACAIGNTSSTNNITGFSAVPSGTYVNGNYLYFGNSCDWWSTTESNNNKAYNRYLDYNAANVKRDGNFKSYANSVRCILDASSSGNGSNNTDGQPCIATAIVTDYDGNVYNTVQIGNQCWMKENLRTTHYANGIGINYGTSASSTNAYRYYPNGNADNVSVYGYLYNWATVMPSSSSILITDDATYTVTVTDNYGCQATASKQMTLYPAAVASITGSTVICGNQSTTLTANGGTYYSWNTGSAQRTITVNQPGTYIATVQTVYGCTANDTVEVVAFANPVINGNTVFCSGGYTTLTATGGENYQWSTGATTASINVNTAGNYSVTASTSNGCSGSASVTVIQNQASNVTISGNTVICSGIGTSLTASSGTDYLWSTGDTTQSISVNNPGAYSVTVTNSNGCSNSATQTVSLMEHPIISGNNHICSGQSATLNANGSGSYAWSTGASTASITVSTPGNYMVTVTLPNGCSSSATVNVSVGTTPTPTILGNTTFCQGETTTLTANGGVSYVWNNASTGNSISVSQSGVYTVTATNAEGCSNTANVTVTVNPLPSVNITGNSSFCQGDNVTLTATGANTYAWSNASSNAAITVSNAGTYTVTGTDANGCSNIATKTVSVNPTYNIPLMHSICQGESYNFYGQNLTTAGTYTHTLQTVNGCDSVLTLTLTVKALPTPTITGNTCLCEGETTTLTANGGVSYVWGNASTSNSVSVSQSGVYTVTATNAEGCSATANVTVTVNPLPTITVSGNTTLCAGNSTTLTASGADNYSWSTGDNTASVSISAFGVYTVTGTSTAGCSNTANVTVLVSQPPVITISGETDICAGESTTLTANGGETYLWSDGTTANTLTVGMAGTHQVIGYNAAGCNAMASATVNVWQPATSEFSIECPDSCYTWNGESYCQSGDYTQTLQTVHGCDSVVTLHLTITVGIDNHDLAASMTVYPNPTTSVINVQFTMNNVQAGTKEFHMYDAYGKLVDVVAANNDGNTQIDLSHFAPGVYFIKAVAEGNVVAVRKVVKQ